MMTMATTTQNPNARVNFILQSGRFVRRKSIFQSTASAVESYSFVFFARGAAFAALAVVARFAAFAALRGWAGVFAAPPAAAFSVLRAFASARARCSALRF